MKTPARKVSPQKLAGRIAGKRMHSGSKADPGASGEAGGVFKGSKKAFLLKRHELSNKV